MIIGTEPGTATIVDTEDIARYEQLFARLKLELLYQATTRPLGRGTAGVEMPRQSATNSLLLWTAMQVLAEANRPIEGRDVLARISEQLDLTPYWLERYSSGQVRWIVAVQFFTGDATTIGWMTKRGGWAITEAGLAAMETFAMPESLFAERGRRYAQVDQRRKKAQESLGEVQQFIARALGLVEAGSWTAFDDIAALAGTSPD